MFDIDPNKLEELKAKIIEVGDFVFLEYKKNNFTKKYKDAVDVCTNIDEEAEIMIRNFLRTNFPEHNIVGEEFEKEDKGSPFSWLIDPIDGTKYFINNISFFTTCIGLAYNGKPIFGIIYNACSKDIIYGGELLGCSYLNGQKIEKVSQKPFEESMILFEYNGKGSSRDCTKRDLFEGILKKTFYRCRNLGASVATFGFDIFRLFTSKKEIDISSTAAILGPVGFEYKVLNCFGNTYYCVGTPEVIEFIEQNIEKVNKIKDEDIDRIFSLLN
ncbi:MAG: inositol monophosphatase [Candidatus Gracilibacteria bacterium]|nr:inositol monophosphatase [Candidatus Gracilibacteria bacterium]